MVSLFRLHTEKAGHTIKLSGGVLQLRAPAQVQQFVRTAVALVHRYSAHPADQISSLVLIGRERGGGGRAGGVRQIMRARKYRR